MAANLIPGDEVLVATQPGGLGEQVAVVTAAPDASHVEVRFRGFGPRAAGTRERAALYRVRRPRAETAVSHRDGLVIFG